MTGTAKTEEVEFEKTYKLETTIVPTNRVRARQDLADQVYKTKPPSGGLLRSKLPISTNRGVRCWWVQLQWKKANCSVHSWPSRRSPQPAQRQARERGAGIRDRCPGWQAGAVTIATNMAGRDRHHPRRQQRLHGSFEVA